MRRFLIGTVLALAALLSTPNTGYAQERQYTLDAHLDSLFPDQPTSYLTDVSGKVTNADDVNARLKQIRETDSLSLVAVVLNTTGDRAVEDVAREIGRKWLVAQKAEIGNVVRNTGGVILLVLDSHKCRVEVARGSEGYMTDGRAADACRNARDNFRAGAFGDGIISIANEFDGYHKQELVEAAKPKVPERPIDWGATILLIVSIVSGIVLLLSLYGLYGRARDRRRAERERVENEKQGYENRIADLEAAARGYETELAKVTARANTAEKKLAAIEQAERERKAELARRDAERRRLAAERAEKKRWDALTPAQQQAELAAKAEAERKAREEAERRRIQAAREAEEARVREAERARLAAIAAAAAAEEARKRRKKREEEEEEERRRSSSSSSSSYGSSSSSYDYGSSSSSSWSSGGSDSFSGGGGGSDW